MFVLCLFRVISEQDLVKIVLDFVTGIWNKGEKMAFVKNTLTDEEQEQILAQAMETDEGRVSLAQAMVEPIRRALE